MSLTLKRLVCNQIIFREVNDRIGELAEKFETSPIDFVCECSRQDCTATVELDLEEYRAIRCSPTLFVIAPDHETLEVEEVRQRMIVKKTCSTGLVERS